jgi:hypothetical protein
VAEVGRAGGRRGTPAAGAVATAPDPKAATGTGADNGAAGLSPMVGALNGAAGRDGGSGGRAGAAGLTGGGVGATGGAAAGGSNSASSRDTAASSAFSSRAMSLSGSAGFSDRNCPIKALRARSYIARRADAGLDLGKFETARDSNE